MSNTLFDYEDERFDKNRYTRIIPKIQYSPKMREAPSPFALYNLEKYMDLVKEVRDCKDIGEEEKKFLMYAATRHIVFDYELIAEYYCHASKKVQGLMEKSGLVIIDFDDALENDFVKLTKNLEELYEESKEQ